MASGIVAQDGLPARLRSTAQAPSALRGIVAARATRRTFPPCRRRPAVSQTSPVLVFLLDRVVSDRVHPGNGIHELPPSLSLAGSSQPGCPDGYAGPRPVAAPRSAAVMKRVLMPHCPTDSAVRWPDASCRLPRGLYRLGMAPGSFGEAARSARQDVSQPNCGVFCNQPRAACIRCFRSNTRAWLAPDELSFG